MLTEVAYWHWLLMAIAFVVLEIFSPAVFFLWLGVAAAVVGLVMLAVPELQATMQMLIFAVFSVVSVYLSRRYMDLNPTPTDQPKLNRRGQQYVDRTFTLVEPIVNGFGKIKVDDTTWKIEGEDAEAGVKVKVVGVDGVVLKVEVIS